uniref:Inner membrane protein YgaP-like transmembrane domain-containing protein n=1 Tax=Rhodopseudomonas palustris (strain BisA53) TaxID=316055 RepID=Q07HL1_RHOP5
MNLDQAVLSFAGSVVLIGLSLGWMVSPYWFLLPAFAGMNMIQASITGFCPAALMFKKLGIAPGNAFN